MAGLSFWKKGRVPEASGKGPFSALSELPAGAQVRRLDPAEYGVSSYSEPDLEEVARISMAGGLSHV